MNKGILLITGGRVGSSNLFKSIWTANKQPHHFELDLINDWASINPSNDVVKFIPFYDDITIKEYNYNELIDYNKVLERSKMFGKVIILNRRDKIEQTESLYVMRVHSNNIHSGRWNDKLIDRDNDTFNNMLSYNKEIDKLLIQLAKDLNIEMDYYEDVYSSQSINDKSIKLTGHWLTPDKRLRMVDKGTSII